ILSFTLVSIFKPEKMSAIPTASQIKKKLSMCTSNDLNYPPPLNYSKMALLVEDRPIPHMTALLLHMISVVPPDWPFLFLGSDNSISFLNSSSGIRHHVKIG